MPRSVALDPVDGARLPVSPASVSVTFNENVSLAPGGLRVIRPDGTLADIGDEVVAGPTVTQAIAPLPDGWYVMAWSIISADGHVVHGSATFAVGDADAAAQPTSSSLPSPLETILWLTRGLSDLMLLMAGGAGVAWVLLGARTRRVRRFWLGILAAGVLALGDLVRDRERRWWRRLAVHGVRHLEHGPAGPPGRRGSRCCCFARHDRAARSSSRRCHC